MADIENIKGLVADSRRGLLDDHQRELDEERQLQAEASAAARADTTDFSIGRYQQPRAIQKPSYAPLPLPAPLAEMEAGPAAVRKQAEEWWEGTDTRLVNGTPANPLDYPKTLVPAERSGLGAPSLGSPSGKPQPAAARPTPQFPAPIKGKTRQGPKEQSERERAARLRRHNTTDEEVEAAQKENRRGDAAAPPSRKVTRNSSGGTVPGWGEKGSDIPAERTNAEKMDAQRGHAAARAEYEQGLKDDEAARTEAAASGRPMPQLPVREQPMFPYYDGGAQNENEMRLDAPTSAQELDPAGEEERPNSQRLLEIINPGGEEKTGISNDDALSAHFGDIEPQHRVQAMRNVIKRHNNNPLTGPAVSHDEENGQKPAPIVHPNTVHREPRAGNRWPLKPQEPGDNRQPTKIQAPNQEAQTILLPDASTIQALEEGINSEDPATRRDALIALAEHSHVDTSQFSQQHAATVGEDIWNGIQRSTAAGNVQGTTRNGGRAMVRGPEGKARDEARQLEMDQKALVKTYPTDSAGNPTSDMIYGATNKAELREIQTGLRRGRASAQAGTGQQHNRNMGEAQNMGFVSFNPAARQAVTLRHSLEDAAGDPEMQAEVLRQHGKFEEADAVIIRHNEEQAIQGGNAELAAARADADPVLRQGRVMGQINGDIRANNIGPALAMWTGQMHPANPDGTKDNAKAQAGFTAHVAALMGANHPYIMDQLDNIWGVTKASWGYQLKNAEFMRAAVAAGIPHGAAQAYLVDHKF